MSPAGIGVGARTANGALHAASPLGSARRPGAAARAGKGAGPVNASPVNAGAGPRRHPERARGYRPRHDGDRRRDDRQRPAQRYGLWAFRLRSPARCRHGVRDRLDHKSVHFAIVGRHGAAGRGGGGRPCIEISARQRQDAGFRGRADHADGPRDLHLGPAADAVEFRAERLEQSLHRLHGRAALRLPVEPQARLQAGQALRIFQSRLRPAGPYPRAARRQEL